MRVEAGELWNGEIGFGKILPNDVKEFLGAAMHDYYNGAGLVTAGQAVIAS